MDNTVKTQNAKIKSTFLGMEDHGIWTFSLNLDYGSAGQSAEGFCLDEPRHKNEKFIGRFGTSKGMQAIMEICKVVGVDSWEELPNKYIRVKANYEKVYAIGNMLEDKWMDFEKFFS